MAKTKIEWATDSWNPIVGCSKVSPGCVNCYAERMAVRLAAMGQEKYKAVTDGKGWNGNLFFGPNSIFVPMHWKKPRRVFVNSMGDTFHKATDIEFLDSIFTVVDQCPQHQFLFLTKRPENMKAYFDSRQSFLFPNVWLGVTICNQAEANEKIPLLLKVPAAVRFVSIEPMLGPVDLTDIIDEETENYEDYINALDCDVSAKDDLKYNGNTLDWVICGGESGPGARPMYPDWVRSLRDQCKAADVPFLFKQWGEYTPDTAWVRPKKIEPHQVRYVYSDGQFREIGKCQLIEGRYDFVLMHKAGKHRAGRTLDGVIHDEYPGVK